MVLLTPKLMGDLSSGGAGLPIDPEDELHQATHVSVKLIFRVDPINPTC